MIRRRGSLVGLLALVQVFLLTFASLAAVDRWVSLPVDDGRYVLLVLGSDEGPARDSNALRGRADAIQLLVVDDGQTHVSIVSIPRDSYVPVRGLGRTKINAMLTRGPENAVGTIEDLTGLQVDDYIVTSFRGFVRGVNSFGGVTVDVDRRLSTGGFGTIVEPGLQELDGKGALAYGRDRKNRPNGDFGRSTAQASLLRLFHRELHDRARSPTLLFHYAGMLRRNTETSLTPTQMTRLGVLALRIDPANVAQETLPGNVGTAGSASVVHLPDSAHAIFTELRENGRLPELE